MTQTVSLDDAVVKFEIWDTAGQERYCGCTYVLQGCSRSCDCLRYHLQGIIRCGQVVGCGAT